MAGRGVRSRSSPVERQASADRCRTRDSSSYLAFSASGRYFKSGDPNGAVAQLGERRVRNAEVEGSIPFRSIGLLEKRGCSRTSVEAATQSLTIRARPSVRKTQGCLSRQQLRSSASHRVVRRHDFEKGNAGPPSRDVGEAP